MSDPQLLDQAEELARSLEADGVRMCSSCGLRPARARRTATGKAPTTCAECAAKKGRGDKRQQKAPPSVRVTIGAPRRGKADSDVAMVAERSKQAALFLAVGLGVVGQDADAAIIASGADTWASAVGGLAPYEPWLVKLCQGGEASGRAMAWATVSMATLGLLAPVLVNHGLIPEGPLKAILESVTDKAAQAQAAAEDEAGLHAGSGPAAAA